MIKKIENIDELSAYNKTDIYSIRIMSLLKAYGTAYDFASFYKQTNEIGEITAIISKLDNDLTISNIDCNYAELAEFIEIIGYSSCLCDKIENYKHKYEEGIIMVSEKKTEIIMPYVQIDEYPKLMDLFDFDSYDSANFEAWYVDINHRIRHGCAKAYSLNVNGEIISSAIFSSIYNGNAILTSVRTSPEFRRMGYGSALVSEMTGDIKGNVYLMRETDKNEYFYRKLGFKNIGMWRMYK